MDITMQHVVDSVKDRPEDPKAWQHVFDVLRNDKELFRADMESAKNSSEFYQSVLPYAMQMADIIHVFETIPVYTLIQESSFILEPHEKGKNGKVEFEGVSRTLLVTVKYRDAPIDRGVLIFFSEEDAKQGCEDFKEQTEEKNVIYAKIPFSLVMDSVFGIIPNDIPVSYILNDYRSGDVEELIIERDTLMAMLFYSTFSLRSSFEYDIYASAQGEIPVDMESKNQGEPTPFPNLRIIRGGKPPVS